MLTKNQIDTLAADLLQRLTIANTTSMTGGVLQFSDFLDDYEKKGQLPGAVANARVILKMTWALQQVSPFIINTVAANPADGQALYNEFAETVGRITGFVRQPWATGEHADYIKDPNSFRMIFQSII